jgi:hypothetical protein
VLGYSASSIISVPVSSVNYIDLRTNLQLASITKKCGCHGYKVKVK